jgi:pyruvate,water dikinase
MRLTILTANSDERDVLASAGGKGVGLYRLTRGGVQVPLWAAIGANVFDHFLTRSGLTEKLLGLLEPNDVDTLQVGIQIEQLLCAQAPDKETLAAIADAYQYVGGNRVAVRSSGIDEDGEILSFAGQYSSFLNVSGLEAVSQHVRRCWASAYSPRCLAYRKMHGRAIVPPGIGVIVQEMVRARKSGVVFTTNPSAPLADEMVINASYGLGEGIVSGSVDPDTIIVARHDRTIRETIIGEKQEQYVLDDDHLAPKVKKVPDHERSILSLSPEEILALIGEAECIEELFGGPQDIEWALAGGELHVLQARPITASMETKHTGGRRIWDNSNIIESYGDIVSPFTFSFARHIYHVVYREYARLLGVPSSAIDEMDSWLDSMIGCFYGRVYYNLMNWYRIVRLVPFYRLNRKMLEFTLGCEVLDDDTAAELHPVDNGNTFRSKAIRLVCAVRFSLYFLTTQRTARRFVDDFYRVFEQFEAVDYRTLPTEEIYLRLKQMESRLLRRWGRTIILEQTIGLTYGILYVLTRRWLPDAPMSLLYEVATPGDDAESLKPAIRLMALGEVVRQDGELMNLLSVGSTTEAYSAIISSSKPNAARLAKAIADYIDEFGYRNANELKLEEPDMREDPSVLIGMLRGVVRQEAVATSGRDDNAHSPSLELRGPRRWVYERTCRKASRALEARERIRFCRTRAFGLVRKMLIAAGENMSEDGLIDADRDIFYLKLEELEGWLNAALPHTELAHLVAMRRHEEQHNRRLDAPSRFETWGTITDTKLCSVGWSQFDAASTSESVPELRGTPCSPGYVIGEVKIVREPGDGAGKILATYRTDPGWVPALPSAAALLIERGGPLTHVAIVARELGVPTIVQIPNLTKRISDGARVSVDGGTGIVKVLDGRSR